MKAILEFDLPEDEAEFKSAQNGWKWKLIVDLFDNQVLRMVARGKSPCPWPTGIEAVQAIRDSLYNLMGEHGLSLMDGE